MWAAILRHYDVHHRPRVEQERAWFASAKNIEEAITRASLATDEHGKRFSHQRRIPRGALQEARTALLAATTAIRDAHDFDELLSIITTSLRDVKRTGELYRYDTALRISYYLDLSPMKVYLHAGTRAGARALQLPLNKNFLEPRELAAELRSRPAAEIEDILCIYKNQFQRHPQRGRSNPVH